MLIPTQKQGKTRNGKSSQTHCQNGHPFDEVNTYISPKSQKRCCRVCQSARNQRDFEKDVDGNRAKNREHMREWRSANRARANRQWTDLRRQKKVWLDAQKIACARCGESDPVCLDFHHKEPSKKTLTLSLAVARASLKRIQKEVEMCEIICSNCHRKLHAAERRSLEKEVA